MQSLLKFAAVALVSLGVGACGTMGGIMGLQHPLEEARAMPPAGTGFDQALTGHYIALSEVEYDQGDIRDGRAYAARARIQSQGETLMPEEIEARPYLAAAYKPELSAARERLVAVLNGNAREGSPQDAATAQAMFDCWMENAEENLQPDHIAACREGFMAAIARAEAGMAVSPAAYMVFFDFDESYLTAEGRRVVESAAQSARQDGYARIIVSGHTDTVGSAEYNQGLSERRADAVRTALVEMGVPNDQIMTRGLGQTQPLVPTGDGVNEPQNRRAEIEIQSSPGS
jgi:OmpA-OmpF porin, OOP family